MLQQEALLSEANTQVAKASLDLERELARTNKEIADRFTELNAADDHLHALGLQFAQCEGESRSLRQQQAQVTGEVYEGRGMGELAQRQADEERRSMAAMIEGLAVSNEQLRTTFMEERKFTQRLDAELEKIHAASQFML